MALWNPFRRVRYEARTSLSPTECGRRILDAMDDYNTPGRGRYVIATTFGDRFTAQIEPGSLGSHGSGAFMRHFVIAASGSVRPAAAGDDKDATGAGTGTMMDVTIGFERPTSAAQVAWRLLLAGVSAISIWMVVAAPVIPVFATSIGAFVVPLILLWSLVAFAQGMRQAGRDWQALRRLVETALDSPLVEHL